MPTHGRMSQAVQKPSPSQGERLKKRELFMLDLTQTAFQGFSDMIHWRSGTQTTARPTLSIYEETDYKAAMEEPYPTPTIGGGTPQGHSGLLILSSAQQEGFQNDPCSRKLFAHREYG